MTTPDELQIQLDELDTRLDRLRALYEQYFVGIEKMEPHVQKKDVERRVQLLRKVQLRNTAARFRFQALVQKYTTYLTYWQRICRNIEEGTYKREVARVQRYGRPSFSSQEAEERPRATEDLGELAAVPAPDADLAVPLDGPLTFPMGQMPATPPAARARIIEEIPLEYLSAASEPATRPVAPRVPPPPTMQQRRVGLSPFGAPSPMRAAPKPGDGPVRRRSSGNMRAQKPAPVKPGAGPAVPTPDAEGPAGSNLANPTAPVAESNRTKK